MTEERRDELLVVRCRLGERDAFTELVHRWHAPLWRYLRGVTGSTQLADDLSQETWLAVIRSIRRLRQPDRFVPWLFTIARRTVVNQLRNPWPGTERPVGRAGDFKDDASETADGPSVEVLNRMEVQEGLDALPPREREVLILFHLQDLPLADCAAVLGVPPGTVKSRLFRARRMLRRALDERGYDERGYEE